MRAVLLLLLASGCDELLAPNDGGGPGVGGTGDTAVTTGCPEGWAAPSSLAANVRSMTLAGQTRAVSLLSIDYLGTPAACVSADGTKVQLLLGEAGQPLAWFTSSAPSQIERELVDEDGVIVDVFGNDPAIEFSGSDWYQGSWVVSLDGDTWRHTINGEARDGIDSMTLFIEVEVEP